MEVVADLQDLRHALRPWHASRARVATCVLSGRVHLGHEGLVATARAVGDRVVAVLLPWFGSIGAADAALGVSLESDLKRLRAQGVDLVFMPDAELMYPAGPAVRLDLGHLGSVLCGEHIPGVIERSVTVIVKSVALTKAHIACVGEKNWQTYRALVRTLQVLCLDVAVHVCPTVRDTDDLPWARRNLLLSEAERRAAAGLPSAVREAAARIAAGAPTSLVSAEVQDLLLDCGYRRVDYVECCKSDALTPVSAPGVGARVFAAARIGGQRIIDNVPVPALDFGESDPLLAV